MRDVSISSMKISNFNYPMLDMCQSPVIDVEKSLFQTWTSYPGLAQWRPGWFSGPREERGGPEFGDWEPDGGTGANPTGREGTLGYNCQCVKFGDVLFLVPLVVDIPLPNLSAVLTLHL